MTMRFERQGMGFVGRFPRDFVELSLARLKMSGGELHGELVVECSHPDATSDGHLLQARFNVSSMSVRTSTAKYLAGRTAKLDIDWASVLEAFCKAVLAAEREGEPFVMVGQRPKREVAPHLLYPIIPRDRATIVFGEGGTGKSYLSAACAIIVSTGIQVVNGWSCARPGPVLVLDWEADEHEWNDRVAAVAGGIGLEPPSIHYRSCIGSLTDQAEDVARYVASHGIALVIVDSVGMATPSAREGTDANEGAKSLFAALRYLRTTALLIDHVTGGDMDRKAVFKPYGSVYKINLARSVYELRRADDDRASTEEGIAHVALYHRKVNGSSLQRPIGLRYHFSTDEAGDTDEVLIVREEMTLPELLAGLSVREQVERSLKGGALLPEQIVSLIDAKPATVRQVLNRFKDDRFTKLADGRWANCYAP